MEFTVETRYNQKALTALAKALRGTTRKKHSRKSHIFGWIVVGMSLWLLFGGDDGFVLNSRSVVTMVAALAIIGTFLFEDALNGYVARKRLPPGVDMAVATFTDEGYRSSVELGESLWKYEKIVSLAETEDYFIFLFSKNHGQVYAKAGLSGGTVDEFRAFIEERAEKTFAFVK